jgi:hypothetical protein
MFVVFLFLFARSQITDDVREVAIGQGRKAMKKRADAGNFVIENHKRVKIYN